MASVSELLPPIDTNTRDGSVTSIRIRLFRLTLNDITVEVSSLGASITKIFLPNYSRILSTAGEKLTRDDVVLSYSSQRDQMNDKNKPYFGAIVGRVANRIKDGRFRLTQTKQSSDGPVDKLVTYQLEKNNGPNHLHGGFDAFCNKIWTSNIVDNTVQFTLISPDGDQGYPGGIQVTATYSLVHIKTEGNDSDGAKLCLEMNASLLAGETKATPVALAQHSYFNLASHSSHSRILEHTLHLPNCTKFTPLDHTSIPTREVQPVDDLGTKSMDFREEKVLADALIQYGKERAGLEHGDALNNVDRVLKNRANNNDDMSERLAKTPKVGGASGSNLDGDSPYGFDHNYAIDMDCQPSSAQGCLRLAAVLSHPPTRRSLRVFTTAPGMQLYTANYLDGMTPRPDLCKDGSSYEQWQGICLETQTYPDSIYPGDTDGDDEFSKGKCFILRTGGKDYDHSVEYEFCSMQP
mmetsp:Transcript_10744/g.23325  ORF Transcript_10744/g.23325 Transcript_10744/m.23325 type:complete len:465 (-) Transcript_10744:216-1610(-)|eukprot:CAMPEP_0172535856 /NCGR_PEP_ID=MMETSP1067-20121228/7690_1 /TAXON_ID=265564 ORGANISM="Thalassiosira punctigera, Strain Tpunct2005C2" /NCGR_SAMPLE_ID=MMETSP1067 /ASSEMBLY_ACC=CAM_ASM_000444 /LENGTH=464 /DNA_ID=CAMNT_0013320813 /DNA_START=34 /DNA_END=1428 /DNA_ORIENTATION=-